MARRASATALPTQRRSLLRARGLEGFRRALVDLALEGPPLAARRRVIVVPTRSAAELLRQAIEGTALDGGRQAVILPDLVTRDEWLRGFATRLADRPSTLSRIERERLLARAARRTGARPWRAGPPFALRPALVAAMLDLYDELRRRQRTVRRFVGALFSELKVERGTDRGSESLIEQTCFLGYAFLAFERATAATGALDEHRLRDRLVAEQPALTAGHVIIAATGRAAGPRGLWPADYDLLGRLRAVTRIDVVATDETLDAGFRDRVERELPGIVETACGAATGASPVLVRPSGTDDAPPCAVSHDREDELRDVVRVIRGRTEPLAAPTAIVFQRPLPYLYLARQVLADGRVPYQTFDAQPLAAESYAALLDLVLAVARTGGTPDTTAALLGCGLLRFGAGERPLEPAEVQALADVLALARETGDTGTYVAAVERFFGDRSWRDGIARESALRAARAAALAGDALAPFREAPAASAQVAAIARFLRAHERPVRDGAAGAERHRRARAAVLGVLDEIVEACARHDDMSEPADDLVAAIHHAIEARTFTPRRGRHGVHLVDAVAARFGAFDHVHLVGLVESDWPERVPRSIFYTSGLLAEAGWPEEADLRRAEQAAFRDLLGLARRTTRLHAFTLEGDTVVALSPMVQVAREWASIEDAPASPIRVFADEILTDDTAPIDALAEGPADWLALRRARPPRDDRRYSGFVPPLAPVAYRVSQVDQFVRCPFKYFARSVLGLPEEREVEAGLTPLERGSLVHELFERFYRAWQAEGRGALTAATVPEALDLFGRVVADAIARLPAPDRALEEGRLLGTLVGRGLAERVFQLEADAGGTIVDRLLEFPLEGPFVFPGLSGLRERSIAIRGKADRIDVFEDGSLRVIDYKLGRMPDLDTSVQVGVYAHAAEQALAAAGRAARVEAAMYLAFGDERRLGGSLGRKGEAVEAAVRDAASRFADAVRRIEAGAFPASPEKTSDCGWCPYAGVCRKEYYRDDDDAAQPV